MTPHDLLANRVTELEILILHMQRELAELNGVVLEQRRELDRLQGKLDQVGHRLTTIEEGPETDPADERPPHY